MAIILSVTFSVSPTPTASRALTRYALGPPHAQRDPAATSHHPVLDVETASPTPVHYPGADAQMVSFTAPDHPAYDARMGSPVTLRRPALAAFMASLTTPRPHLAGAAYSGTVPSTPQMDL